MDRWVLTLHMASIWLAFNFAVVVYLTVISTAGRISKRMQTRLIGQAAAANQAHRAQVLLIDRYPQFRARGKF